MLKNREEILILKPFAHSSLDVCLLGKTPQILIIFRNKYPATFSHFTSLCFSQSGAKWAVVHSPEHNFTNTTQYVTAVIKNLASDNERCLSGFFTHIHYFQDFFQDFSQDSLKELLIIMPTFNLGCHHCIISFHLQEAEKFFILRKYFRS